MKKVVMYTLSTCPWCRKARKFFKERGLPFEYIDYDLQDKEDQERILKDMENHGRGIQFPFTKIDGEVVVGYDPEKFEELLEVD